MFYAHFKGMCDIIEYRYDSGNLLYLVVSRIQLVLYNRSQGNLGGDNAV